MGPKKKGGAGKKGGKKKDGLVDLEADLKAFNLAERQVIMELVEKMYELRDKNESLKDRKGELDVRKFEGEEHIVSLTIIM